MSETTHRRLGLVALAGLLLVLTSCSKEGPTVESETRQKKYEEAARSFGADATSDGGKHAAGIREFFDQYAKATAASDATSLMQLLDARTTLRLLEEQGLLPRSLRGREERLIPLLERSLGERLMAPGSSANWVRYEVRHVRFLQEDREALVYARHWDADGVSSKMRWWLCRRGERWRAYDFEELGIGMRLSAMLGMGFLMAEKDAPWAQDLPRFLTAAQQAMGGDLAGSLAEFEQLEEAKLPAVLESLRLSVMAALHGELQQFDKALKAVERAAGANPDLPDIHLLYSAAYNGLKQHAKALEHAEQYAGMLGKDADYYELVGNAYAGMGRTADAIAAYQSGLADDPSSGPNVLGLMRVLPETRRDEVVAHYKRLKGANDWFVYLADQLLRAKDPATLRTLIEIHSSVSPKDGNLSDYDDACKQLEEEAGKPETTPSRQDQ